MLTKDIYLKAIDSTRDGLIITKAKGKENPIVYVNPAFELLSGFRKSEILGKDCRFLQGTEIDQPQIAEIRAAIDNGESILITLRNQRKDGSIFLNELSISPIKNDIGEITHFIGIQKDVTEKVELKNKLMEANKSLGDLNSKLEQDNKIDSLTGAYNRKAINHEVSILWASAKRSNGHISVLFVDIDHFKAINDTYGHSAGDVCLKHLSNVLKSMCERESDIVLRYGGEEFIVVSIGNKKDAAIALANKLLSSVSYEAIKVKEPDIRVKYTLSIGVTSGRPHSKVTFEEFVAAADKAMYEAKMRGRNMVVFRGI